MRPSGRVWRKSGRVTAQRHNEHPLPNPAEMSPRDIVKEAEAILHDIAVHKEARAWIEDIWEDMPEFMTDKEVRFFIRRYYDGGWEGFCQDTDSLHRR